MNRVYQEFVSDPFPARTTVITDLLQGILIEVDAVLVID